MSGYSISTSANSQAVGSASLNSSSASVSTASDGTVSAQSSAQDTFSALDANSNSVQPVWTHTSARHAEAGYLDPNLGWVSVRADVQGHSVHATVVPSSTDAAQTISQHMGGLGSYLQEQNSSVRSIGLASPSGQDLQSGTQSGAGQDSNYSGTSSGNRDAQSASSAIDAGLDLNAASSTLSAAGTGDSVSVLREGSRISLVA